MIITEKRKQVFWNTVTILNLLLSFMVAVYHNNGYNFYEPNVSQSVETIIDWFGNGLVANLPVLLFITLSAFLLYRNITLINISVR